MVKVKLANVDPRAFSEARGKFVISATKHGAVVGKWPKKRGPAKEGYNLYRQLEFGLLAKWAASPFDLDLGTAIEMAKGTEQVPRDILMMTMIGGYYEIVAPDGTVWEQARMSTNPQYILDNVTFEHGAMLYRNPVGWLGLPPGTDGQVLCMHDQQPFWGQPTGQPSQSLYASNAWGSASSTASATKGQVYKPLIDHEITALVSWATEVLGAQYQWSIWRTGTGYKLEELMGRSAIATAPDSAAVARVLNFPAPVRLYANIEYALLFTRLDGSSTSPAGLRSGGDDPTSAPIHKTDTYLRFNTTLPALGQTPDTTGSNPYSYGLIARIS